jgi:Uncharacterised nucleotidyltransferase
MPTATINTWARGQLAKATIATTARVLHAHDITIMPLKGVDLIARYGRPAAERSLSDADALVEPGCFDRACSALLASGFRETIPGWSEVAFSPPAEGLALDLHRTVLPSLMGTMSTQWLFSRGQADSDTYGQRVVHMHPADAFVYLLCNHLKDRLPRARVHTVVDDLALLTQHATVGEVGAAATATGLRLACWLTLDQVLGQRPTPQLTPYLEIFRPSPLARRRAMLHRSSLLSLRRPYPLLSLAVTMATTDSIPRGVASAALCLGRVDGVLRRARAVFG